MENRRGTSPWKDPASDPGDPAGLRDVAPFLSQARSTVDPAKLLPSNRMKGPKRMILRFFRFYTDRQLTFNRSVLHLLGILDGAVGRLSRRLNELDRLTREHVHEAEEGAMETEAAVSRLEDEVRDLRERAAALERELESLRAGLGDRS
jgi:hypothetical protein